MWLRHGTCSGLCVWQTVGRRFTEENVLLQRRNLTEHVIRDKQRDLVVAVDGPIHLKIIVIFAEWID